MQEDQMKILANMLCGVLLCLGATAQDHASHAQTHPVTMVTGLGDLHHPVSTHNPQAQQFFDQGLRFIYAFNHDEAARSFQHASELDPSWPWLIGAWLRPWDRTTTIRPIRTVTSMPTTQCRRRSIFLSRLRPANRPTFRPSPSGFRQILLLT